MSAWPMRRQLMLAFAIFAVVVAVLFGMFAVAFTYAVEDTFFENALRDEAAAQHSHHAASGQWTAPRSEDMRVYTDPAAFPADLRERFLEYPSGSEFAGTQGRHYHVLRLAPAQGEAAPAFLVAEVHRQLVVRRLRGEMLGWLAWSALAVLGLALAIGYALARRTTAPLAALTARIQTMRPSDPPQALADPAATREVGVLAAGLEALAARVHALIRREREFTRDASHELRTPLAVIHSACERLGHDDSLAEPARRQVEFLRQSVWQLGRTVELLLTLAREEHAIAPAEAVAVLPLVEQVVLEQAIALGGKKVAIDVDVPATTRVHAPPLVLRIVLSNLIGNAFAHTTHGGRVRIDHDGVHLRIANSEPLACGPVDAAATPFAKGSASTGWGLGLAIVARLCERHAIGLDIESTASGTCARLAAAASV